MNQVFDGQNIELKTFFLDTKNNPEEKQVNKKVQQALEEIEQFKPDVLIVSDDAAVKYVIVPHFKNKPLPVVFCGVNWSAASYGLPVENITGMLEVLPLRKNLQTMQSYYPGAKMLTVLSENSLSEQKNKEILDTLYRNLGFTVQYALADNFSDWKKKFQEANATADIIYMPTNGAIKNWNAKEAVTFVKEQIRKPVITCDDFMMPYCVYGLTKVAEEQGKWAGEKALEIMKGKSPGEIPVTANHESVSYINSELASKTGFKPRADLVNNSQLVH